MSIILQTASSCLLQRAKKADAFISANPHVALGANDRRGLLALNDIARYEIIGKWLDEGIEFCCTDGVSIGNNVTIVMEQRYTVELYLEETPLSVRTAISATTA